jgi:hypothetical protein
MNSFIFCAPIKKNRKHEVLFNYKTMNFHTVLPSVDFTRVFQEMVQQLRVILSGDLDHTSVWEQTFNCL